MVVVGVGTVGSQIALELANAGVGTLWLIDGDHLESDNLIRHALTREYVGQNKAAAMATFLSEQVPDIRVRVEPRFLTDSMPDAALDRLIGQGDLVIVATDNRVAQRRIAGRAIELDVPAILPALYGDSGGEVFVQRSARHPCFFCWDGYRSTDERLRGVAAINADTLAVLQLAVHLSLGILDPSSADARLMVADDDPRPMQLFIQRPLAALDMLPQPWRAGCPQCPIGPQSPIEAPADPLALRTAVWQALTRTLGTLAVLAIIGFIITSSHIRQGTAVGFALTLAILAGLWILYVNAMELMEAWEAYRRAQRLSQ